MSTYRIVNGILLYLYDRLKSMAVHFAAESYNLLCGRCSWNSDVHNEL